ncbi:MAG: efflux RND transporter periplasmic adaptor subunit [Bacteroidota bacterium]
MKTRTNRSYFLQLISLGLILLVLANPVSTARASDANRPVAAQKTVTASGVVVPTHTAQLGFLISGLAREIPVNEGDLVQAGQTLMVLDTPDLQFAVNEAQAALRSAQSYADLQKYRRVKNQRNGRTFYDVIPAVFRQRADAKVQQAQVALELAQINLAEGTLTAPFEGTVTSLKVIPGEYVPSDEAVLTLATLDDLQIETTDLSERDIANVKVGVPVNIHVEALNETFTGKVVNLSPKANVVGGDTVFKVTIAFDTQPKDLLWGMTADVTFNAP